MNGRLFLGALVAVLVAADWASKVWITRIMSLGETRTVIDGWLYLAHRANPGVAFSMFADLPDAWRAPLLSLVSVIGLVLFVGLARSTEDWITRLASALVISGAIGNLGDRLVNGHVTDFILVSFFPFVFNVADSAISVGGVLLAFRLIFAEEPKPASPEDPERSSPPSTATG